MRNFSKGFVTFFVLFALIAYAGIWRLIAGDAAVGRTLMELAIFAGYIALAFELIAMHSASVARQALPRILG